MNKQEHHTAKVTVIDGCNCPANRRWFHCRCEVVAQDYFCEAFDAEHDRDMPSVAAVADIIKLHPKSKLIYLGGNSKIIGGEGDGTKTLHELAQQLAQ